MALILTEEQSMLQESAREFLQKKAPVKHLRSLRDQGSESGFDAAIWQEMSAMGWPAMIIPEAYDGLGFGYTGMGLVLQETGRSLTPSPLFSSGLVAASAFELLANEKQKSDYLPKIASGTTIVSLAWDESNRYQPFAINTTAEADGSGYHLNGQKLAVIDGMGATHFLVSARVEGEADLSLFVLEANQTGLTRSASRALDTHVFANLRLENIVVDAAARLGAQSYSEGELSRVLDIARIGQCAELLGVARETFERTMAYLRERKQFGVPIGSFQALQHRAAMLYSELEMCKSMVLNALQQLDAGQQDLAELASCCKAKLSEIAMRATAEGIQMHGGIGMTDEFEIGFFYKRARILETLLGDRHYHLDRFALQRGY
ncbi:MAG: acyl-CoA dehydrogenase family protein [Xanthomonadales bacterium]|nr:acyl-CoA dehydrogenase family protein [Xanthomonadales bacterium]